MFKAQPTLEVLIHRAETALMAWDREEQMHCLELALSLEPRDPHLWNLLIDSHWVFDESHQGLAIWYQAAALRPESVASCLSLGNLQRDLNAFEAAEAAYARAMELGSTQEQREVAWNRSQNLIGLECYEQAYVLAEQRLAMVQHDVWRSPPYWHGWCDGSAAAATDQPRTITIWSEQGFGDTLQYLRWLPRLLQCGHAVRLEVEPPLLPLLRQGLAWLGPDLTIVPKGVAPRPLIDPCHGSLLSLPWLLGGAPMPEPFPPQGLGYLRSPSWPRAAKAAGRPPRVGLVWATGRKQKDPFLRREYERRSLPAPVLVHLLEGLEQAGAELVCLQFGEDRRRADAWDGTFAATLADGVSLADNAHWIAALDLVITVDTAMAHLVGAMGALGWVLLPWAADPRWLRDRVDSPWYPSLTLLRQPAHRDWDGLVQRILRRFQQWRAT